MVRNLLLGVVFLVATSAFAQQDKKWSVEANYSIVPSNGFGGDDNLINIGLKYRFIETNFIRLGLGLDGGYFIENTTFEESRLDGNLFLIQPKLISEIKLPFSKRLRLTGGIGYSIFTGSSLDAGSFGGFNFNIGLIYDISDKWFVQFQYDFVSLREINAMPGLEGHNNFRLGVGFRF
jgi:hypothetical protein